MHHLFIKVSTKLHQSTRLGWKQYTLQKMAEDQQSLHSSVCCNVAYALNSKKLRAAAVKSMPTISEHGTLMDEKKTDTMKWCGGGLATIVNAGGDNQAEGHENDEGKGNIEGIDGVLFSPFGISDTTLVHSDCDDRSENRENNNNEKHREYPSTNRDNERPFHVILHKLTEDISAAASKGVISDKLAELQFYMHQHSHVVLTDPIEAIERVVNREKTSLCLQHLKEHWSEIMHKRIQRSRSSDNCNTMKRRSNEIVCYDDDADECSIMCNCPFDLPKFVVLGNRQHKNFTNKQYSDSTSSYTCGDDETEMEMPTVTEHGLDDYTFSSTSLTADYRDTSSPISGTCTGSVSDLSTPPPEEGEEGVSRPKTHLSLSTVHLEGQLIGERETADGGPKWSEAYSDTEGDDGMSTHSSHHSVNSGVTYASVSSHSFNYSRENDDVVLENLSCEDILEIMRENHLVFPIICKPIEACGFPHSHLLTIVFNADGLTSIVGKSMLIQQFLPHNGTFYKVYAIGPDVLAFTRPSIVLPSQYLEMVDNSTLDGKHSNLINNIDDNEEELSENAYCCQSNLCDGNTDTDIRAHKGYICFDSQQLSKFTKQQATPLYTTPPSISPSLMKRFESTAAGIQQEFGLHLFGFDVVSPNCCPNELMVIDVNYFPSYKEVEDFPKRLRQFLRRAANLGEWIPVNK